MTVNHCHNLGTKSALLKKGYLVILIPISKIMLFIIHQVEDPELTEITLEDRVLEVVHGTYYRHWPSIKEQGLSRMNRTHIHFAPGLPGDSAVISGMRTSCQLYIWINLPKALEGRCESV